MLLKNRLPKSKLFKKIRVYYYQSDIISVNKIHFLRSASKFDFQMDIEMVY